MGSGGPGGLCEAYCRISGRHVSVLVWVVFKSWERRSRKIVKFKMEQKNGGKTELLCNCG